VRSKAEVSLTEIEVSETVISEEVTQLTEEEDEVIQSKKLKAGSASPRSEVKNVAFESQSVNVECAGT
jgi:hypothetical protein